MTRINSKDSSLPPRKAWRQTIVLEAQSKLGPGLYVTATPIGNLRDITLRALETLASADLILCEDTRVSRKLLDAYNIQVPLAAYHDHNGAKMRPKVLSQLSDGAAICLISDAGMPLVSDPGYKLVCDVVAAGYDVQVLPGANAPLSALSVSALPTDRFVFLGFLPAKASARQALLSRVAAIPASLILFESPRRLAATLAELEKTLGTREVAVARELTKKFEEVRRGTLQDLAAAYAGQAAPKGEIVIVVGPGEAAPAAESDVIAALKKALKTASTKDAAAEVSELCGWPKRQVYELALSLRADSDP